MIREKATQYFKRFDVRQIYSDTQMGDDTKMVIVIPAYCEPALVDTLISLWSAKPSDCVVSVFVVINFSALATKKVKDSNMEHASIVEQWFAKNNNDQIFGSVIRAFDLIDKYAGVGLARKTGMDHALNAFMNINCDGWIVNLDADCTVSNNFLIEQEQAWLEERRGAICYFEHAMDLQGMITYELYLRYYVQALKWAGFTHATHTVGSTFAVRASVYAEIGGMNRRKAGEDFYFIQKMIQNGNVKQLTQATVFPSDRLSDRVPFGTGKAIANFYEFEHVYHFGIFRVLKHWLQFLNTLNHAHAVGVLNNIPLDLEKYMTETYEQQIKEIAQNTSDQLSFTNRVLRWFNNFQVMKFIHRLRDEHGFENRPLQEVSVMLLTEHSITPNEIDLKSLLLHYRKLDKKWLDD